MRQTVSGELRKLRATPTMWWLLVGVAGLSVAATLGALVIDQARGLAPMSETTLRDAMHSAGSGSILVVVAGIVSMAGEFRFGQADQTFLSNPRRAQVVGSKVLVFALLGAVFGIAACVVSVATMAAWFAQDGESLPLGREVIWLTAAGAVSSATLFGALGVGIGALSRLQVPAIVATLAWFIVLEPITMQINTSAAQWLPGNAALALRRVPQADLLSMRVGATVLLAWTALALAIGLRRTTHEDIT